jgi:uncharacterized protein (DUF58 family)
MLFKEVREYHAGDDIRIIDWNVSARFNHPYSKVFEEERELTVVLLVDISASSKFGTHSASKMERIAEIASVLAFAAVSNNDKVGLLFYSDKVEKFIPPKKGREHALYLVRELISAQPSGKSTNLGEALRRMNNALRHGSISFVLSDFQDSSFQDSLKVAGKKHDLIGIKVYDLMEQQLPDVGLLEVEELETGRKHLLDTGDPVLRQQYQNLFFRHTEWCKQVFLKAGCDLLHFRTDQDYVQVLQRFFIGRGK